MHTNHKCTVAVAMPCFACTYRRDCEWFRPLLLLMFKPWLLAAAAAAATVSETGVASTVKVKKKKCVVTGTTALT